MSSRDLDPDTLRQIIEGDDELARADALIELGLHHYRETEWVEAEGCFGSAIDLLSKHDRPIPLHYSYRVLGDTQSRQERFEESVESYRRAVAGSRETGDVTNKAYAAGAMGDSLRALNRIDEALVMHEEAAGAFSEINNPGMMGTNLLAVANILFRRNQVKAAAEQSIAAYNQFQMAGNPYRAAIAKDLLADSLAAQGEYAEALVHAQDVSDILFQMTEEDAYRAAEYSRGLILLESGKLAAAQEVFRVCTIENRNNQDHADAAKTELAGLVAQFREDIQETWLSIKRDLPRLRAYFDAAGRGVDVVKTDRFMAEWYSLQEAWPKAVRILRQVVERCQELGEANLERSTRARLASALIEIGEYQEAAEVLAPVDESHWGDVKPEIEYLRQVRETLEIRLTPEAD